jgi:glyoxylase-like metal-dependent hydrolase (beta-lactamase superfamily II)
MPSKAWYVFACEVLVIGGEGTVKEIVSGIFTWSRFSEPHGYNFNGYLVVAAGGNLCIDPVEPGPDRLDQIAAHGVARILLTNRNHGRAANEIRARTGARTAIHPDDADHAREQGGEIDDALHADDRVGPFTVVAVPGKSPGEVAFHWPERRILIVGDAVIGHPPGKCGLLREAVLDDPERLKQSVRSLLDLDFDTLLMGDAEPILKGAKERLSDLVAIFGP